ncbi:MAG: hypothetical protein A2068_07910 [Ignavibacteria bacterium GWB2_35_6b]|nr:MAG: hypothetical protein A2068_07910 [Ignavibacteria bacterium GWB2_35_6b]
MRTLKLISASILFLLIAVNIINAQSDFDKVQNFKTKYKQIEESIKNASDLNQCFDIENEIIKLKGDFTADKKLLDNSLYPLNFDSSIDKLVSALETRKGDFTQITELKEEVSGLKEKITVLDKQNYALLEQIKDLDAGRRKDAATIESLRKLTDQLRSSLRKRDELVVGIIDSLLAEFVNHPFTLNEAERISFDKKIEYNNLFYNVERTISDNIEFITVTKLEPDDFADIKEKYSSFSKMWKQIGPRLGDVYLNRAEKTAAIERIDSRFGQWNYAINSQMWRSINSLFLEKNIKLLSYNSGSEFTERVTGFIEDEIKNIGVKKSEESENMYYTFADTLWFEKIQPEWVPVLIENRMLEEAQKDTIEARIANWKAQIVPEGLAWWIYIIGIVVLILIILGITSVLKKKQVS